MKLCDFLFFLGVMLGLGLWTVAEERRAVRFGYKIGRLKRERAVLEERRQDMRFTASRLASPYNLEHQAREFALDLTAPGEKPSRPRGGRGQQSAPIQRRLMATTNGPRAQR